MRDNHVPGPLFIKDLIRRVHRELMESQKERIDSGEPPIFFVKDLVIEANFVAVHSREAKGGVDFRMLTVSGIELGGQQSYRTEAIHKLTISLSATTEGASTILGDLDSSASCVRPRSG